MTTTRTLARTACLVAGLAFVADTVTIVVIDRSFDPLDSVLFFAGLIAMVVGLVAASLTLSEGRSPRWLWSLAAFVGLTVVIGLVGQLGDSLARHLYTGDNLGLRTEWSFFLIGLQLLAVSGLLRRAPARQASATISGAR